MKINNKIAILIIVPICLIGLTIIVTWATLYLFSGVEITTSEPSEPNVKFHGKVIQPIPRPPRTHKDIGEMVVGETGYGMNAGLNDDGTLRMSGIVVPEYRDGIFDIKILRTKDGYEVWLPDRLRADKEN